MILEARVVGRGVLIPWSQSLKARRPRLHKAMLPVIMLVGVVSIVTANVLSRIGDAGDALYDWIGYDR